MIIIIIITIIILLLLLLLSLPISTYDLCIFRVMFGEVLHTTQLFMRDLTVVDPLWLEELAPHYFQKITEKS